MCFVFRTAGTHTCLCSRGMVLLILSLLPVFGSSQYNSLAASTPILSVFGLRFVLEHLSVKPSYVTLSTKKKIFWRDICCTWYALKLTQPATKYYSATSTFRIFFVLTFTPHALNRSPRVVGSISTSYRYPIIYQGISCARRQKITNYLHFQ